MALTKVSTDGVKDDAITKTKIPANQIEASELADNAVDTNAIADQAVALSKLPHGTSSNNGKFLRANNGADPTFETVSTDLVADTSPQLGGDLASNGHDIKLADTDKITAGTGDDLLIYHDGSHSYIYDTGVGKLRLVTNSFRLLETDNTASMITADENGAVELYYDGGKKLETHAHGIRLNGAETGAQFQLGAGNDFQIEHDGSNTYIYNLTNDLVLQNDAAVKITAKAGGTPRFRFDSDGLKFGSDTAAANALDDYEEGEWTPAFGNGLVASSYESNGQRGQYTKIGNVVHFTAILHLATASTQNGNVIDISGLPFTSGDYSNIGAPAGGMSYFYQDGFYNSNGFTGIVQDTTTTIRLYRADTGAYLTGTSVNGGREIRIRGTYTTPT